MTDPATPLEKTYWRIVEALRAHRVGPEEQRTQRLKETAALFVDAREHFFTKTGDVDWTGKTYAYRMWVRQTAIDAGYPPDEVSTVLAAVRYHVGDALRRRIGEEHVVELGLTGETARERSIGKRERASRVLSLVNGQGAETPEDVVELLRLFVGALGRVDAGTVRSASAEVAATIAEEVAAARTRLTQVLAASR
jgi:hypothetical protein